MASEEDPKHYEILGVAEDAAANDIKQAFRKLSQEYHPDKNPGATPAVLRLAEQKQIQINAAYEELSDPVKRSKYDAKRAKDALDAEKERAEAARKEELGELVIKISTAKASGDLEQAVKWARQLYEKLPSDDNVLDVYTNLMYELAASLAQERDYRDWIEAKRLLKLVARLAKDEDLKRRAIADLEIIAGRDATHGFSPSSSAASAVASHASHRSSGGAATPVSSATSPARPIPIWLGVVAGISIIFAIATLSSSSSSTGSSGSTGSSTGVSRVEVPREWLRPMNTRTDELRNDPASESEEARRKTAEDVVGSWLQAGATADPVGDGDTASSDELTREERAATSGDAEAMCRIGGFYSVGFGVPKDKKKAVEWFRRAAELGSRDGMYFLGGAYVEGDGIEKNEAEGVRWTLRAAELGHPAAMNAIAGTYQCGCGVPLDYSKAVFWYRKAASTDVVRVANLAIYSLGNLSRFGQGMPKNQKQAWNLFLEVVNRKGNDPVSRRAHGYAMRQLGEMCEAGESVRRDISEAIRWYRKAAELGDDDAQTHLRRLGTTR